jgi:tetratricopeptide (TPR) repeat protein
VVIAPTPAKAAVQPLPEGQGLAEGRSGPSVEGEPSSPARPEAESPKPVHAAVEPAVADNAKPVHAAVEPAVAGNAKPVHAAVEPAVADNAKPVHAAVEPVVTATAKPVRAAVAPAVAEKPQPETAAAPARQAAVASPRHLAVATPRERTAPAAAASADDQRQAAEVYARGNSQLFQGHVDEAIASFKEAQKLDPRNPAPLRGLGLAYVQAGNSAQATHFLKRYLKAAPTASDRPLIEKRLEQLGAR